MVETEIKFSVSENSLGKGVQVSSVSALEEHLKVLVLWILNVMGVIKVLSCFQGQRNGAIDRLHTTYGDVRAWLFEDGGVHLYKLVIREKAQAKIDRLQYQLACAHSEFVQLERNNRSVYAYYDRLVTKHREAADTALNWSGWLGTGGERELNQLSYLPNAQGFLRQKQKADRQCEKRNRFVIDMGKSVFCKPNVVEDYHNNPEQLAEDLDINLEDLDEHIVVNS